MGEKVYSLQEVFDSPDGTLFRVGDKKVKVRRFPMSGGYFSKLFFEAQGDWGWVSCDLTSLWVSAEFIKVEPIKAEDGA